LGEGYFFRAFDYFNLLKLYGGVPIINKVLLPTDSAFHTPGLPVMWCWILILNDLNNAIADLPVKSSARQAGSARNSPGLQSAVCLFEGTWRKFHAAGDANSLLIRPLRNQECDRQVIVHSTRGKGDGDYRYHVN